MNNKVIKIFSIIIVICTICTFIALPLFYNGLPDDEDKVCRYVSYNNTNKNYGSYVTIYEGKYTLFDKDMYVFTDEYAYKDYVTYALYMDGDEIKYYCDFGISGYHYYIGESYYKIPHRTIRLDTSVVVRADNCRTVYLNGDIYEGDLTW